ncbi:MAG: class I SAM-dependent methyltransferase [Gaiellaceae bacterium]
MTERARGDVVAAFDAASDYWDSIYEETTVEAVVYQTRRAVVERWLAGLPVAAGARVLEVGPGAGHTTVALAERGLDVDALDVSEPMLVRVAERARAAGVESRVHTRRGPAESVDAPGGAYALVVAVGLIPWVEDPARTVSELARVVEPGGWVLLTSDNRARLTFFLDPFVNPWLERSRAIGRRARDLVRRRQARRPDVLWHMYSRRFVDDLLRANGLETVHAATIGFGPFTLAGRHVLSSRAGTRVHRALQRLADRRVPVLRATGSHYVVLARKERS